MRDREFYARQREQAQAAEGHGLLRHAARLRKSAALSGDALAAAELITELRGVFPDARNPPWPVAEHVALDDPRSAAELMSELRRAGADEQIAALASRGPGHHAECGDLAGAVSLLGELRRTGATTQADVLAGRLAAGAALEDPAQVLSLISGLRGAQANEQLAALLARDPAAHVALDAPETVVALVLELRGVAADGQALALANRAGARYAGHDPESASRVSAALHVNLDNHDEAFAFRFIYGTYEPAVAASLLTMLTRAGEKEKIRLFLQLLASDPAGIVPLEDASGVAQLLGALHALNADEQIRALLARDPVAHIAPGDLPGAVRMLAALRRLKMAEHYSLRLPDLVGRVSAEDPLSLALLLNMLAEDKAGSEIAALLERCPAARVGMRDSRGVAVLLEMLRALGAHQEADVLVDRLAGGGQFRLFLAQGDNRTRYRFGRDEDGTPAEPWGWDDLG
ncbi:MAG TPA: hypothetical protein VGG75_18760 [Trebonia sp.]|jgi:hypothetical protein